MNLLKRTQNKDISCKIYQFWNIFLWACFELIYLRKCIALSHSVHDFGLACFSVFVVIYKSSFARDKIKYSARKKSHQLKLCILSVASASTHFLSKKNKIISLKVVISFWHMSLLQDQYIILDVPWGLCTCSSKPTLVLFIFL